MKRLSPLTFLILLLAAAFCSHAQVQEPVWELHASPKSEITYSPEGEITWSNGIVISNRSVSLTADRGIANPSTGDVRAQGRVTILGKNHIWEGTNLFYNFKTGKMEAGEFKTAAGPFFVEGSGLGAIQTNKVYSARNSVVTTDDYAEPLYTVRARVLIIVPNQYIEAYDATLYLGSVPVFYYPHYKRSLGRHPNNYAVTPGYQTTYGAYLLNTYNWYFSTNLEGAVHFDYRQRRGYAGGPDFDYRLGRVGDGSFKYYYARDDDPNVDAIGTMLPSDRKRLSFVHIAEPVTNLTAKLIARYQSDPQVLRDFFESEYRTNVQPSSYAEVTHLWPNFTLDALAQPQIVNFFETVERLPDVKLSASRQQVGVTPVFYEGENSFGYFRRKFASTNESIFTDYSAARGDTFHQFVLPQTFFGWLNVVPRVGGRATYYSDVYGPRVATNEQVRGVFNTGAEVSTKASRVWRGAESRLLDADGFRHIIEPSVNYVYVPNPSRAPSELPQFDYATPSLRLPPIDFPDYNSIDSIDSQNVLRLSLRNKLQTKRAEGVDNLVNWALYTDWRIDPRTNQSTFADIFSDMDLKPRSWLLFNSQLRYDVENARWRETYHRVLVRPNNTWSASLSHRYLLNNDPEFITMPGEQIPGNNTFTSSLFYRLNENWGARMSHRFEGRDGKLEEQYYTIYRDLRSWTSALTFRFRENRAGQKSDFTVAVTFSLKAFPRYGLGADTDRPSMLLGY